MLPSMPTPIRYAHSHGGTVHSYQLWRTPGHPTMEPMGVWCPLCGFEPNDYAARLRSEALDAIADAKRAQLDAPTPTKAAKRPKVRPFFTP
jgi:hypothetical protein